MLQTKVVRKLQHILCSKPKSCRLWDNVEKYDRARHTIVGSTIRRRRVVIFMLGSWGKNTDTNSQRLILIIANSSMKYFADRQRCISMATVILDTLIVFTATSMTITIKRSVLLRFHGNNGYANASQCNVVRTVSISLGMEKWGQSGGRGITKPPQHIFKPTANNTGHWPLK